MKTIVVFYWAIVIIGTAVVVTQIIIPAVNGRPLFPLLRKENRALEGELAEVQEEMDRRSLKQRIKNLRRNRV